MLNVLNRKMIKLIAFINIFSVTLAYSQNGYEVTPEEQLLENIVGLLGKSEISDKNFQDIFNVYSTSNASKDSRQVFENFVEAANKLGIGSPVYEQSLETWLANEPGVNNNANLIRSLKINKGAQFEAGRCSAATIKRLKAVENIGLIGFLGSFAYGFYQKDQKKMDKIEPGLLVGGACGLVAFLALLASSEYCQSQN